MSARNPMRQIPTASSKSFEVFCHCTLIFNDTIMNSAEVNVYIFLFAADKNKRTEQETEVHIKWFKRSRMLVVIGRL